jgi:hypothetical protein
MRKTIWRLLSFFATVTFIVALRTGSLPAGINASVSLEQHIGDSARLGHMPPNFAEYLGDGDNLISVQFGLASTNLIGQHSEGDAHILIGPNLRVNPLGDGIHMEPHLAVDPTNSRNLIAADFLVTPDGRTVCQTYGSKDSGNSWTVAGAFQELIPCGDPQVAYGVTGTAYFAALHSSADGGLEFSRSVDNGKTWQPFINMVLGLVDHPQIVVDQTSGRFRGRVYVCLNRGNSLEIYSSDDDGRIFSGPHVLDTVSYGVSAKNDIVVVQNPLVFAEGKLLVPIVVIRASNPSVHALLCTSSTDGGNSFHKFVSIADAQTVPLDVPWTEQDPALFAQTLFGAAFAGFGPPGANSKHVYAVWENVSSGHTKLMFKRSLDEGQTWSVARGLDQGAPVNSWQYQPTLAVNKRGVLGVTWFDTRNGTSPDNYDLYFTASLDGGGTFLSARRATSVSSSLFAPGNLATRGSLTSEGFDGNYYEFSSPGEFRFGGGDYMGLVADDEGSFHPLYIDSRAGLFELWTTQIRLGIRPTCSTSHLVKSAVDQQVELLFGPEKFDSEKRELRIEVRLKNTSSETLCGPFLAAIKEIQIFAHSSGDGVQIRNAMNGKSGSGAVFDFSTATRDFVDLPPGATSEAVVWTFALAPRPTPFRLRISVTGYRASTTN